MSDFKSSGISGIAIETELLRCDEAGSRRVSELLNHGEEYDAIIQLGLAENRKEISFELWAHNYSNFTIADNSGRIVDEIIIEGGLEKYETTVSKHILDEEFETLFNKYGPRCLRQEMNWQVTMLAVIQRERETGEKMSLDDIGAFYWTLGLRHEELELHEMEDA